MNRLIFWLAIFGTLPAGAATPFTHAMNRLAFIAEHPDVWKTIHGPVLSVELIRADRGISIYRFKIQESVAQLQPQEVNGETMMLTTGWRQEARYFEATVRVHRDPTLPGNTTGGPEFVLDRFEDVTERVLCEQRLEVPPAAARVD